MYGGLEPLAIDRGDGRDERVATSRTRRARSSSTAASGSTSRACSCRATPRRRRRLGRRRLAVTFGAGDARPGGPAGPAPTATCCSTVDRAQGTCALQHANVGVAGQGLAGGRGRRDHRPRRRRRPATRPTLDLGAARRRSPSRRRRSAQTLPSTRRRAGRGPDRRAVDQGGRPGAGRRHADDERLDVYDELAHPSRPAALDRQDPPGATIPRTRTRSSTSTPAPTTRQLADSSGRSLMVALQTPKGHEARGSPRRQRRRARPDRRRAWRARRPTPTRRREGDRPGRARRDRRHRHRRAARRRRPTTTPTLCAVGRRRLIAHAERLRYRIAVVDAPRGSSMTEIRDFRGKFDSKYAALYHPWIEILDPARAAGPGRAAAADAAAAVGLRHRHLRPQRHRARRAQGAGQRGRARPDQVRGEHQHGRAGRAQPRGHQRPALLRGPRQPGVGRAHHDARTRSGSTSTSAGCSSSSSTRSTRRCSGRCSSRTTSGCGRTSGSTVEDFLFVQWQNGALLGSQAGGGVLRRAATARR